MYDAIVVGARCSGAPTAMLLARRVHQVLVVDRATLEPPPPEMQELLAAVAGRGPAMDDFASVIAGTLSPPEFFAAPLQSARSAEVSQTG